MVAGLNSVAWGEAWVAIDEDFSLLNEAITCSAGPYAGRGKVFIEADALVWFRWIGGHGGKRGQKKKRSLEEGPAEKDSIA